MQEVTAPLMALPLATLIANMFGILIATGISVAIVATLAYSVRAAIKFFKNG